MDDFQTFKKLMVKRNMELQLEAIRSLKAISGRYVLNQVVLGASRQKLKYYIMCYYNCISRRTMSSAHVPYETRDSFVSDEDEELEEALKLSAEMALSQTLSQTYGSGDYKDRDEDDDADHRDPIKAKEKKFKDHNDADVLSEYQKRHIEAEMQDVLQQSLMEMEIMHRQEVTIGSYLMDFYRIDNIPIKLTQTCDICI